MQAKNPYTDPEMKQYFSTLPTALQESILQSALKFENLAHLRRFVDNVSQEK